MDAQKVKTEKSAAKLSKAQEFLLWLCFFCVTFAISLAVEVIYGDITLSSWSIVRNAALYSAGYVLLQWVSALIEDRFKQFKNSRKPNK